DRHLPDVSAGSLSTGATRGYAVSSAVDNRTERACQGRPSASGGRPGGRPRPGAGEPVHRIEVPGEKYRAHRNAGSPAAAVADAARSVADASARTRAALRRKANCMIPRGTV